MSVAAVSWAYKQELSRSSSKFILVTLANLVRHDDTEAWEIYASVDYLAKATNMNRKTVLDALRKLRTDGYIVDTGRLGGSNRCVPIYRLVQPAPQDNANEANNLPEPGASVNAGGKQPSTPSSGSDNKTTPPNKPSNKGPNHAGSPGKRIDQLWSLSPEWRAWAKQQHRNWTDSKVETVAAIFHAHWSSDTSPQAWKDDWFGAWRLWVLREREKFESTPKVTGLPSATETDANGNIDFAAMGAKLRQAMQNQKNGIPPGQASNSDQWQDAFIDVDMVEKKG